MSAAESRLRTTRAARYAAKAEFDERLAIVKTDIESRGVGSRVADKLTEEAKSAAGQALEVAEDSKGIIAGTIALLVLWMMRNSILGWVGALKPGREEEETGNDEE